MKPGKYIVIEGHDGTGKSTQAKLIRQRLAENGIESIEFNEPAGNPMADALRELFVNGNIPRETMTEVLMLSASRCDIWKTRALPALESGVWVVATRNYFSTLAFQGYGSGIDLDTIETITKIATDDHYIKPDHLLILNLDSYEERVRRIGNRGKLENPDSQESKPQNFQDRVRLGYLDLAKKRNLPVISADQSISDITDEIWKEINTSLK